MGAALLTAASGILFGQSSEPAKSNLSAAYYHATLGHLYSELTAQYGGRSEYLNKAIENYKLAMREDPGSSYIPQELADLYLQSGQVRTAITEFEDAVKKDPDDIGSRRVLARFYAARISQGAQQHLDEEMLKAAIAQYEIVSKKAPGDVDTWMMLGRLYRGASESQKAEQAYQKALELDPDNEEGQTGLALVYGDEGQNEKASMLLKRVADKNPSLRTLVALASASEQMKDFKGAAEAYRRALDLNRDNLDLKRAYALSLFKASDYDAALRAFEEITTDEPGDLDSTLRISQIYRQKKDYAKAHEYATKASELDPGNIYAQDNEVSLLSAEGKFQEAIKALKDMIGGLPKHPASAADRQTRTELTERLGQLYVGTDQTELGVAAFREILDSDPDSAPSAAAQIVEAYRSGKDFASANRENTAFLKRYPDNRFLKLENGRLQADLGQFKEAETTMKSLLDGKSDREIWLSLAEVHEKAKNWTAMGQDIDKAAELSTNGDEKEGVNFMRGAMYERMKKFEQAEAEFRKVLEANPTSPSTLNYLGYMLADRNTRLNEALSMIQQAVDQEPTNSAFLDSLGWVYFRLNRLDEAEESLRRSLQYGSRDATVYDHLGDVCLSRNKIKDAIKLWERSLKEWQVNAPSDNDPVEVGKVQQKLEKARVRLAQEHGAMKRDQ
jgi:tetratricopeptide (TPR) repeat protein